ncbi:MAG: ABC transporter permease [Flavobacteriales bacterium]|jgi:putative ABC transport system permease protein
MVRFVLGLIVETFLFSWESLVANKLRTALSLLGVSIGIFSIIFVLSVVDSLEADMKSSLESIGSDIVFIQKWPMGPEDGAEEYEWWKYMSRRQPLEKDMERLRDRLIGFSAMAFAADDVKTVAYKNNYVSEAGITGVSYEYKETISFDLSEGRYFLPLECDGGRNVAVIGADIADALFAGASAIGKDIKVGGLKVQVIGVVAKEGASIFGSGFDNQVILPIRFASRIINPLYTDSQIIVKASPGITVGELKDRMTPVFREVRGLKPKSSNDFSLIESSMISGIVDNIIGVFNVVGMIIGIFAILVGAFSIANIMFVSVKERTNLIGIQKAIGAKNYFILLQFLFESIALCLFGGIMGLLAVRGVIGVLNLALDFEFILPWLRIFMGLGIAVVVGVISGIAPALSAARLNPVEAMRAK